MIEFSHLSYVTSSSCFNPRYDLFLNLTTWICSLKLTQNWRQRVQKSVKLMATDQAAVLNKFWAWTHRKFTTVMVFKNLKNNNYDSCPSTTSNKDRNLSCELTRTVPPPTLNNEKYILRTLIFCSDSSCLGSTFHTELFHTDHISCQLPY